MASIPSETISQCTEDVISSIQQSLNCNRQFNLFDFNDVTPILSERAVAYLGSRIMIHTHLTNAPFTKLHFENGLQEAINLSSEDEEPAELASVGNPGHDITINQERYSLKTQAGKSTSFNSIHISKWMELGSNQNWGEDENVLTELRDEFLAHLRGYERVLVLRYLPGTKANSTYEHYYELIEIPKALLLLCEDGELEMKFNSRQNPKPGYCYVNQDDSRLFSLYFDGGGERKLQIKQILKERCVLHATWEFNA